MIVPVASITSIVPSPVVNVMGVFASSGSKGTVIVCVAGGSVGRRREGRSGTAVPEPNGPPRNWMSVAPASSCQPSPSRSCQTRPMIVVRSKTGSAMMFTVALASFPTWAPLRRTRAVFVAGPSATPLPIWVAYRTSTISPIASDSGPIVTGSVPVVAMTTATSSAVPSLPSSPARISKGVSATRRRPPGRLSSTVSADRAKDPSFATRIVYMTTSPGLGSDTSAAFVTKREVTERSTTVGSFSPASFGLPSPSPSGWTPSSERSSAKIVPSTAERALTTA